MPPGGYDLRPQDRSLLRESPPGTIPGTRGSERVDPRGARARSPATARGSDIRYSVRGPRVRRPAIRHERRRRRARGAAHRWRAEYDVHAAARCGPDIVVGAVKAESNGNRMPGRRRPARRDGDDWSLGSRIPIAHPMERSFSICDRRPTRRLSVATPRVAEHDRSSGCEPDHLARRETTRAGLDSRQEEGPVVEIADAEGGHIRELTGVETGCQPDWSSNGSSGSSGGAVETSS